MILRPGTVTKVRVIACAKPNDPLCRNDPSGGFPDNVQLQQLTGGHEYPPSTLAPRPPLPSPSQAQVRYDGWCNQSTSGQITLGKAGGSVGRRFARLGQLGVPQAA